VQSTFEWCVQHCITFQHEVSALVSIGSSPYFLAAASGPATHILVNFDCKLRGNVSKQSTPLSAFVGEDCWDEECCEHSYEDESVMDRSWKCVDVLQHTTNEAPSRRHHEVPSQTPSQKRDTIMTNSTRRSSQSAYDSPNKIFHSVHASPTKFVGDLDLGLADVHALAACVCSDGPETALLVSGGGDRTAVLWDVSAWHNIVQARES
jgi:hypothetical protein